VVTFGFARTVETANRRRAALLEGVALGLKTLERQVPLFACHGADTVDGSLFGVNDRIRALRVQWAGDRLSGVIVGWPLFFSPQFASIDQETNEVVVPHQGLGFTAVEPPVCTEVMAALGPLPGLCSIVSRSRVRNSSGSELDAGVTGTTTGIS